MLNELLDECPDLASVGVTPDIDAADATPDLCVDHVGKADDG